ncbi:MAG TPA: hypothetical protein VKR53_04740 [Puia sp.]|nr:hypothetical protein [Puia sp.]
MKRLFLSLLIIFPAYSFSQLVPMLPKTFVQTAVPAAGPAISFNPWLPLSGTNWNRTSSDKFYEQTFSNESFQFLNSLSVQINSTQGSFYSEVIAANLSVFRISLGSLASISKDTSTKNQTVSTLLAGGGNAIFNISYPIYASVGPYSNAYINFNLIKASIQLPALGSYTITNSTYNFQSGLEFYGDYSTNDKEKFKFYGLARIAYIVGGSDFYKNLNIPSKLFYFGTLNCGIIINGKYAIAISFPFLSSYGSLLKVPVSFGTQVVPFQKNQ